MQPQRISNLQVLVLEGLRPVEDSREPMLVYNYILDNREEELVDEPRFEKMGVAIVVGTYKPFPTKFPLQLDGFIHAKFWWTNNLHGDSWWGHTRPANGPSNEPWPSRGPRRHQWPTMPLQLGLGKCLGWLVATPPLCSQPIGVPTYCLRLGMSASCPS